MEQFNVRLVDTISVWWYVVAFIVPIVGFFAGITYMAKSKIGPSIALWMTAWLGAAFWTAILVAEKLHG